MVQISRDLGGTHWLQYDIDFREWAATKKVKVWESGISPYMVNVQPFVNVLGQLQDLISPNACRETSQVPRFANWLLLQMGICQKSASNCRYHHMPGLLRRFKVTKTRGFTRSSQCRKRKLAEQKNHTATKKLLFCKQTDM